MTTAAGMSVLVGIVSAIVSGWSLFSGTTERRWTRVERLLKLADALGDELLCAELRKDAAHLARALYLRERRFEVLTMHTYMHRSGLLAEGWPAEMMQMLAPGRDKRRLSAVTGVSCVMGGLLLVLATAWPGSKNPQLAPAFALATAAVAGFQYYWTVVRKTRFSRRMVDPDVLLALEEGLRSEARRAWPPDYWKATE